MMDRTNVVPNLARCCSNCETGAPDLNSCSLDPAGPRARLATIRDITRRSRLWSERSHLSMRAGFSPSEQGALRTLIDAESARFPFLTFELATDDGEMILSVSAPEHAREAAWDVFDAFDGTASAETT